MCSMSEITPLLHIPHTLDTSVASHSVGPGHGSGLMVMVIWFVLDAQR